MVARSLPPRAAPESPCSVCGVATYELLAPMIDGKRDDSGAVIDVNPARVSGVALYYNLIHDSYGNPVFVRHFDERHNGADVLVEHRHS